MRKIYFEKRCIIICGPDDHSLSDPNAVKFYPGDRLDIRRLVKMFEDSTVPNKVYITTEDAEGMYRDVCSEFREVTAAGGLVTDGKGDFLLICRNGVWDLPKGHQEEGEEISVTALREVEEETGVGNLELGDLICVTDHCYLRNGIWHLKHTWWFNMRHNGTVNPVPQTEENISMAVWIAGSSLPQFLTDTYPSIAEVFRVKLFEQSNRIK